MVVLYLADFVIHEHYALKSALVERDNVLLDWN